ncbi:MAG: SIMPL domain-containing protein [Acidimicrobiales bacterium]
MRTRTITIAAVTGVLLALATAGTALAFAAPGGSGGATAGDPGAADAAACTASAPKLTVQGTGMAEATPTMLTVSVGINVTAPSAQASLTADDSKASAVTTALEQGGVLQKDVQTSNLSIQPSVNSHGVITGYQVSNTLTANLRNFANAGSVIDALANAAGNSIQINSLTFSVADPRSLEDQARNQAVSQAVSHARSMAQAAGERLGPVCSLSDVATQYPQNQTFAPSLGDQAAAGSAVPLSPGTQQQSAQVSIVYALEPPAPKSRQK